jgi:hypothetical protein
MKLISLFWVFLFVGLVSIPVFAAGDDEELILCQSLDNSTRIPPPFGISSNALSLFLLAVAVSVLFAASVGMFSSHYNISGAAFLLLAIGLLICIYFTVICSFWTDIDQSQVSQFLIGY